MGDVMDIDYYQWLRDIDSDADVMRYIDAENNYTNAIMDHTWSLQTTLADEMLSRYVGSDTHNTSFWQQGHYTYYLRTQAGSLYDIYCRIANDDSNAVEEILLDVNQLVAANNSAFLTIGVFEVSPDENLLAFSVDNGIFFINICTTLI
jgi:oligopeptidase B